MDIAEQYANPDWSDSDRKYDFKTMKKMMPSQVSLDKKKFHQEYGPVVIDHLGMPVSLKEKINIETYS